MAGHCPRCWVLGLEDTNTCQENEQWSKQSSYRVPEWVKNNTKRPNAYRPELVSLGPFHHGHPDLKPMEEHKRRVLRHVVRRSGKPLREFVAAVEEVAQQLEDAYEGLGEDWRGVANRDRFVQLMVTDGCFLLEVMVVYMGGTVAGYAYNDPVFSKHSRLHLFSVIQRDTFLMENQLPLLLLERLAAVQRDTYLIQVTNEMVLNFLGRPRRPDYVVDINHQLGLHPLDVLHKSFCGTFRARATTGAGHAMPSATGLHEAGIHFKVSETDNGNLQGIHFKGGVLSIPKIVVDDNTEKMFLNLIAYERQHNGGSNDVTAYLFFMDNIIDTAKDVALLRSNMIVDNLLGSDEEVANLFNALGSGLVLDASSTHFDVQKQVNAHCKKRWNKWRASFMHTYLSNPWLVISLVAATVLLVATLLQTIYTVLSSYNSKP